MTVGGLAASGCCAGFVNHSEVRNELPRNRNRGWRRRTAGSSIDGGVISCLRVERLAVCSLDVFDWMTRVLPGSVVTFALDMMIDSLRFMGLRVSETAKITERTIAVLQIFVGGAVVGALLAWITQHSDLRRSLVVGAGIGSIVGVAMSAVSIDIEGSEVSPVLVILWLGIVFSVWVARWGL